jgi:aspartate aminotransferase
MKLAQRTKHVALSPTFRINAMARAMAADGIDVVDFSVGEPDFDTPPSAKDAGKTAIDRNFTRYTANEGTIELRRAIAEKLASDNGLTYAPDQILVSSGAKSSLYCAAMALFGPDDEVLIPAPYWVSYPEQIRLAGARPLVIETGEANGFKLTARQLDVEVGTRTRGIVLNYPANPTGACYDRTELAALADVVIQHDLVVVADEIYEKLLYDRRTFTSIAAVSPEMASRTIVVNGMSKAFAMTGWRLGYAAGPKAIIEAMAKVQSHATSHPSSISQAAGEVALRGAADDVRRMAAEFERRRNAVVTFLGKLPGLTLVPPAGAFYVFPNVSGLYKRGVAGKRVSSGQEVAEALLEKARVAVVPGEAFGAADHIRISFSCSMQRLQDGLARIAAAVTA